MGRLTTSSRYAGSGTSATNSWCERGIDYDLNGNIVTLQRFGSNSITAEDNLLYGYSGNRLTALTGSSQGAELNASYSYDAGGNMLYDGRRGLGISYNILNLPAKVVEKTGATVADGAVKAEYLYSADGIKQRVVDGAGSNGYLYLGTLVLSKSGESYSLASTGFGGGRIIGTANNSCLAYYYGTDHLGSVRVITDGSGSVVERNDYYPMGMRTATGNSYPQLTTNLYKYNGKEVQTVGSLGFTDYGARMYDDFTGRWFVPDPLAEKYTSMSPYMYCDGNPIMYVDTDGKEPRIFVETKGVGHAFVTVGSGDNTIVYTYGRYGELGKNKSFARSTTPTGEGILIRLSGERAKEFIKDQMIEKGAKAYEFKDGSDDAVMKYYDDLFYSSDKIPKVGKYAGDSDARVINTYNLFNNNCVTTSIDGIKAGSKESIDLKWLMCPDNLEFVLSNKVERANSNVITIEYEDLKKELNLKNGAGGSW